MAKRDKGTIRTNAGTTTTNAALAAMGDAIGAPKASEKKPAAAPAREGAQGRGGGAVDARGKKHRKPMPADPGGAQSGGQNAHRKDDGQDVPAPRARLAVHIRSHMTA